MNNQVLICPHCHEANALDDHMCFACYSPLDESNMGTEAESRRLVKEKNVKTQPRLAPKSLARFIQDAFPFALVGLTCASGYLPRRWRVPTLALSATTLGAMCAHASWYNSRHAHNETPRAEDEIAYRIADDIFCYVHQAGNSSFHIEVGPRIVDVFYAIEGQYHSRMKIPLKMWPEVREEIYVRLRAGKTQINSVEDSENRRIVTLAISALIEVDKDRETMKINLAEIV